MVKVAFSGSSGHSYSMTVTLYRETNGRMHYYSIFDNQGLLFDGYEFTVVWGPDLNRGRQKQYHFVTRRAMLAKFRLLMKKRIDDGYRLLYTFSRETENDILSPIVRETAG
jgi:hypothetical protein